MALAMFPPNARFFKLGLSKAVLRSLEMMGESKDSVIAQLADIEEDIIDFLEASNMRAAIYESFRQLIAPGNFLIWIDKEGNFTGIGLRNYVAIRDPVGNVVEVIAHQELSLIHI